jgi:hypothetical protein
MEGKISEPNSSWIVIFVNNIMKQLLFIFVLVIVIGGCKKDEKVRSSGTDTINNTTHMSSTYYIYGFSFSSGQQVATTTTPGPDITVYVNVDNPLLAPRLYLATSALRPSFAKVGDYNDEASAKAAFDNLKTITATQWVDLADPAVPNQVWIYRSGQDNYTKFRIISTTIDKRNNPELNQTVDFGEISFQWVHQPDGSLTFP